VETAQLCNGDKSLYPIKIYFHKSPLIFGIVY